MYKLVTCPLHGKVKRKDLIVDMRERTSRGMEKFRAERENRLNKDRGLDQVIRGLEHREKSQREQKEGGKEGAEMKTKRKKNRNSRFIRRMSSHGGKRSPGPAEV